ncbi:ZIP family metal transporter [Kangiella koreensis]|uniref:Divalent heavy-metal cations transporter n=1 Tax=Kangiella koreensis (strain DSM 16069 / JCM 12317 / KCTC 12182 / SW-125) TaxID=523791 RepID=C7R9U9_KANKD|nr:divalent cation transporter [Kangiella koreensis]ACV27968.1 divalent heavy-metal cations transporter [Kangiella koreensis DSM 16069]
MSEVLTIIILTGLAGACIPLGGLLARFEKFRPQWLDKEFRHFVIAFGGGILIGAIAVVLVPEGKSQLSVPLLAIPIFLGGGLCFFGVERILGLRRREAPQLMGMVLDYVPEAIALGGMVAVEAKAAPLLALLIGLQNLPEGFNSYRELKQLKKPSDKNWTILVMMGLVLLGPASGLIGYFLLSDFPDVLGGIMLFASGGILYLIFQDIAPQSRLNHHWAPPLGAVLGFCVALFSEMVVSH